LGGNFTVKQLAEAAQECLGGIEIAFKTENVIDPRSYKVSFDRAKNELGFKAIVDLNTGGSEIVFESRKLIDSDVDLMDRKTNRLLQIKFLLENGIDLDSASFNLDSALALATASNDSLASKHINAAIEKRKLLNI
jgi:hypothetical protein